MIQYLQPLSLPDEEPKQGGQGRSEGDISLQDITSFSEGGVGKPALLWSQPEPMHCTNS